MRCTLLLFALLFGCGGRQPNRTDSNPQEVAHTVEDTVRYQIGGKLFYTHIDTATDSITVIKTVYHQPEGGALYREYHFIVHNHYSLAHRHFEDTSLNAWCSHRLAELLGNPHEQSLRQRFDTTPVRRIDAIINDFSGYWVYLKEHEGSYYLDDGWACSKRYLYIADSLLIFDCQELNLQKIVEATPLPNDGISLLINTYNAYDGSQYVKIEPFDKGKSIYRTDYLGTSFITPVSAIHNFEIIQYTNNTGDAL